MKRACERSPPVPPQEREDGNSGFKKQENMVLFNWMVIPTLLVGYLLFWFGYWLASKVKSKWRLTTIALMACIPALPGVLTAIYYLHLFDSWAAFYQFRSLPGSELLASGVGLGGGIIAFSAKQAAGQRIASTFGLVTIMTLGIVLPHLKPLLAPADLNNFTNSWNGAVCKQSKGYSCGAASAVTILHHYGIEATEKEIAEECFTYSGGTENWYIARALRARGLEVSFQTKVNLKEITVPCIAGVEVAGVGHFIAILEDLGDSYRTGDPLVGERNHPKKSIQSFYSFTGFFMEVNSGRW